MNPKVKRVIGAAFGWTMCGALFSVVPSCAGPSGDSSSNGPAVYIGDSLRSGDLVCRMGDGFFSDVFRRYSGGDERFSHIGVVHREDSLLFVVHAEASELTGVGSVRMDPLSDFLDHASDYAFYSVKEDSIRLRIDSFASDYALRNTPFDISFDLASDSALYCTELVATCINRAAGDSSLVSPYPLRSGFSYYRIDDILRSGVVE